MNRALLFPLLLLLPLLLCGQWRSDISGSWSGLLLQNEGGFADQFELYMNLEQIGLGVKGTAFVKLGELEAEMRLSGYQTPDGSWRISEIEILRNNKGGLAVAWCMKEYDLRADYRDGELVLTGPWWGNSEYGPCIPGSITLRKRLKVASLLGGQHPVDIEAHGQVHNGDDALHGGFPVRRDKNTVPASGLRL